MCQKSIDKILHSSTALFCTNFAFYYYDFILSIVEIINFTSTTALINYHFIALFCNIQIFILYLTIVFWNMINKLYSFIPLKKMFAIKQHKNSVHNQNIINTSFTLTFDTSFDIYVEKCIILSVKKAPNLNMNIIVFFFKHTN